MIKKSFLRYCICLILSAISTVFHAQTTAESKDHNVFAKPLLEIVHETPRIVYATITVISEDTITNTRKVNVILHRTLKGGDIPSNFTAILHKQPYRSSFDAAFDVAFTALFFLHEEGGEWHINNPVYSCSYLNIKNDKIILKDVNIALGTPAVSFDDFEEGLNF